MFHDTTFPPPDGRLAGLMRELHALGSDDIGAAIDAMIAALDQRDGDPDEEDDERGGEMMTAPGVDYDPALDDVTLDGLPGAPEDAEEDDHSGDIGDQGEPGAWPEADYQPVAMQTYGEEDDEPGNPDLQREYQRRARRRSCDRIDISGAKRLGWYRHSLRRTAPRLCMGSDL